MEGTIGEIKLFAGNFAPRNWAFCNGERLSVSDNPALFSILGTQYGGDGRSHFELPSIKPLKESDKGPNASRYIICLQGINPSRH